MHARDSWGVSCAVCEQSCGTEGWVTRACVLPHLIRLYCTRETSGGVETDANRSIVVWYQLAEDRWSPSVVVSALAHFHIYLFRFIFFFWVELFNKIMFDATRPATRMCLCLHRVLRFMWEHIRYHSCFEFAVTMFSFKFVNRCKCVLCVCEFAIERARTPALSMISGQTVVYRGKHTI